MLFRSNTRINHKRTKSSDKFQEDQLNAMRDLTSTLTKVDKTMKSASKPPRHVEEEEKKHNAINSISSLIKKK